MIVLTVKHRPVDKPCHSFGTAQLPPRDTKKVGNKAELCGIFSSTPWFFKGQRGMLTRYQG